LSFNIKKKKKEEKCVHRARMFQLPVLLKNKFKKKWKNGKKMFPLSAKVLKSKLTFFLWSLTWCIDFK
jgi:hypothetical protein